MTSKSDPRGHPGLKLCVHVSVMGYYRFINFHKNRRGSGIFLGDFTWNDPNVSKILTSKVRLPIFKLVLKIYSLKKHDAIPYMLLLTHYKSTTTAPNIISIYQFYHLVATNMKC